MTPRSFAFARRTRTLSVAATIAACVAWLVASASCILADPPPELPKPPKHHPIIVKGSVVPPYTRILPELPHSFIVPLEILDPDSSYFYNVFVDYDPISPRPADFTSAPQQSTTIDFGLSPVTDLSTCHSIELVVALGFDPKSQHTPDSNGADSIVWWYNPSGDPGHCPQYDAGGDGAFPDQDAGIFVPNEGGGQ